jgi:hypothetical protein
MKFGAATLGVSTVAVVAAAVATPVREATQWIQAMCGLQDA